MAMGDATDRLGSINPSDLIGRAVVEPRAVVNLANAFRSGFITADDIIQRSGESAQLKQKAEVQLLSEQVSPEAIAARAAQRDAAAAQAGLVGAQAGAQLPLVEPTAALAATQLEEQQAVQKYGPGVEYFKALAPEGGVSAPVTTEGAPDYGKRAQLGLQLFEWKQQKERAKERLTPAHWEKSPDGTQLFKFNKQGELITPQLERSLATQAVSNFSQIAPGAAVTAPAPAATVTAIEVTPAQRAAAVEQFGVEPAQAAVMTGADMNALVQPKTASTSPSALVEPAAGATTFLGPAKAKDAPDKFVPAEGVKDIAMSRQAGTIAKRLQDRYTDLVNSEPNLVGFIQGRLATWAKSKEWNTKVAAFQRDATAILAPIAKGTYNETGVLSDKDVARYEGVIPSLRDSPKVGHQKISDLFNETRGSLNNKIDSWQRAGYDVSGFQDLMITPAQQPAATAPGASGGVLSLPSTGRRIVRDANGTYRLVQ
jgi:hypothetical protein